MTVINEQNVAKEVKSEEQLYSDFAELIYDIYTDNQKISEDSNIVIIESQKLEY